MKPVIKTPFFEIGTKNYIWGDKVLELALAADKAARDYDIDVLFTCPVTEIRRVAERTERLVILAPYMDVLRPGRGMADILPEALKDAGARGVIVNHCEKPMSIPQIKQTIERAAELDFLVFACADTIAEAKAVAQLHPDILNPEPSEFIGGGSGQVSSLDYVRETVRQVKAVYADILVEQHYKGAASVRFYYGRKRCGGRRVRNCKCRRSRKNGSRYDCRRPTCSRRFKVGLL